MKMVFLYLNPWNPGWVQSNINAAQQGDAPEPLRGPVIVDVGRTKGTDKKINFIVN